ncbi:MAG: zinc dependent phospholipase C family protein, partial [Spirochaetaceae bacterium]|nr:zinc dependent phospholipase C family protein [Spirochaetaceae bacterium]
MPAQMLHALFGETVIESLSRMIGAGFRPYLEAARGDCQRVFVLGCQGPDIFYHSQMTRPVALEYGTLLHRRGFGRFAAALLAQTLTVPPRPAPLALYALGFMTHGLLDRACHPYIVYKSSAMKAGAPGRYAGLSDGQAHAFFERILDALMLEALRGIAPSRWDQAALAEVCADPPAGLGEMLADTLARVFPERAGDDRKLSQRIPNALRDCAVFYRLTDPRNPGADAPPACVYPSRLPLSVDYLNLRRGSWHYPVREGPAEDRSFPDIYRDAVLDGAARCYRFMAPSFKTRC